LCNVNYLHVRISSVIFSDFLLSKASVNRIFTVYSGQTYHSVQNLLSYCLRAKNVKIRIYKIMLLPMTQYGYETLSLSLRAEHRLRVFENRVLRRIFGPRGEEVTGGS
jgi:hypothetical protein